ncbi:MAG: carboxypeptidase-like regulatory domain-containing protein [Bacteroidetes bacterium]|nr:carboxypeptidase-like regulatory domain-containing protein [Bacteroidota bacterium]MDA1119214.1 carboxypeptidase-like regulatory domain-containing protein [Bacteroidota bacterium]
MGYGKIKGQIIDNENNEPVPFATVTLIDTQTKAIVGGSIAVNKGDFTIKSIKAGSYNVVISFIGYDELQLGPIEITNKGNTENLGKTGISMQTTELKEVVVVGERELVEEKVDRLVYNAENDETTKGGDASEYSTNTRKNLNFKVNFSYRFGKLEVAQPRRRRSVQNNELKQQESNDQPAEN